MNELELKKAAAKAWAAKAAWLADLEEFQTLTAKLYDAVDARTKSLKKMNFAANKYGRFNTDREKWHGEFQKWMKKYTQNVDKVKKLEYECTILNIKQTASWQKYDESEYKIHISKPPVSP